MYSVSSNREFSLKPTFLPRRFRVFSRDFPLPPRLITGTLCQLLEPSRSASLLTNHGSFAPLLYRSAVRPSVRPLDRRETFEAPKEGREKGRKEGWNRVRARPALSIHRSVDRRHRCAALDALQSFKALLTKLTAYVRVAPYQLAYTSTYAHVCPCERCY